MVDVIGWSMICELNCMVLESCSWYMGVGRYRNVGGTGIGMGG